MNGIIQQQSVVTKIRSKAVSIADLLKFGSLFQRSVTVHLRCIVLILPLLVNPATLDSRARLSRPLTEAPEFYSTQPSLKDVTVTPQQQQQQPQEREQQMMAEQQLQQQLLQMQLQQQLQQQQAAATAIPPNDAATPLLRFFPTLLPEDGYYTDQFGRRIIITPPQQQPLTTASLAALDAQSIEQQPERFVKAIQALGGKITAGPQVNGGVPSTVQPVDQTATLSPTGLATNQSPFPFSPSQWNDWSTLQATVQQQTLQQLTSPFSPVPLYPSVWQQQYVKPVSPFLKQTQNEIVYPAVQSIGYSTAFPAITSIVSPVVTPTITPTVTSNISPVVTPNVIPTVSPLVTNPTNIYASKVKQYFLPQATAPTLTQPSTSDLQQQRTKIRFADSDVTITLDPSIGSSPTMPSFVDLSPLYGTSSLKPQIILSSSTSRIDASPNPAAVRGGFLGFATLQQLQQPKLTQAMNGFGLTGVPMAIPQAFLQNGVADFVTHPITQLPSVAAVLQNNGSAISTPLTVGSEPITSLANRVPIPLDTLTPTPYNRPRDQDYQSIERLLQYDPTLQQSIQFYPAVLNTQLGKVEGTIAVPSGAAARLALRGAPAVGPLANITGGYSALERAGPLPTSGGLASGPANAVPFGVPLFTEPFTPIGSLAPLAASLLYSPLLAGRYATAYPALTRLAALYRPNGLFGANSPFFGPGVLGGLQGTYPFAPANLQQPTSFTPAVNPNPSITALSRGPVAMLGSSGRMTGMVGAMGGLLGRGRWLGTRGGPGMSGFGLATRGLVGLGMGGGSAAMRGGQGFSLAGRGGTGFVGRR